MISKGRITVPREVRRIVVCGSVIACCGESDRTATSLLVLVLDEAGVPRDNAQLKRGLSWLLSNQNATEGSWPASSVNMRSHISGLYFFANDSH